MPTASIVPLPKSVVDEDHRLEKAAAGADTALMKLRWHWTVDESNANRVSAFQYAKQVGRSEATIYRYAEGYALFVSPRLKGKVTPDEARLRADMSAEKFAAVKAVAEARNVKPKYAAERYPEEVRRVRETARERAETKRTSVEEELPKAAAWQVKAQTARVREKEEKVQRHGLRYVQTEGKLQDAKRKVIEAIEAAVGVDFDHEERDLLRHTIGEVREALQLAESAIVGKAGAGWDEKLRVLKGGA
jgi:hypothetical protein